MFMCGDPCMLRCCFLFFVCLCVVGVFCGALCFFLFCVFMLCYVSVFCVCCVYAVCAVLLCVLCV